MSLKFTITKNQLNKLGLYNLNVEAVLKYDSKFCEDNSEFKILENEDSSDEYTNFTEYNVNIEKILKTIKNILDEGKWCDFENEKNEIKKSISYANIEKILKILEKGKCGDFDNQKIDILKDYETIKSNFMKYIATDEEISNAIIMYKKILTEAELQENSALEFIEILKSKSENTEIQIRLLGAMAQVTSEFPDGISRDDLMNISEKWGVLDYITEEMLDHFKK